MSKRDTTRARRSKHVPRASTRTPRPERAVSLRLELSELREAVLAARLVADSIVHSGAQCAEDASRAPGACAAVLVLVDERFRLIDAVLTGDVDARAILGPRNEVHGDREVDDDVVLPVDRVRLPSRRGGRP